MARVFNFSAGPATLPQAVVQRVKEELQDWQGCGLSVMEMSHRGKEFTEIAAKAENDIRNILQIPDSYRVLFLQGGASAQFAMVPLNLLANRRIASYVCTGSWSEKAINEAKRFCDINIVANSANCDHQGIPDVAQWSYDSDSAYLHYTSNETIGGVEFPFIPESNGIPLVSDMSSNIFSRSLDVNKFGLIYAGAQKNMGIAGITLVIVRDDLLQEPRGDIPSTFDYRKHAANNSMFNTPPTFNWYVMGLVFDWIREIGGLEVMERLNQEKADTLYQAIDSSSFYSNPVMPAYRSRMNVPFILADTGLDSKFLLEARVSGMVELKGHRSVGGMRASIYNAMPMDGVNVLVEFMQEFERRYG